MSALTLFDFLSGKQLWPQVVPRDMSLFAPVVPIDPAHSPDWWRPEVRSRSGSGTRQRIL
jgi:hypothetical protein